MYSFGGTITILFKLNFYYHLITVTKKSTKQITIFKGKNCAPLESFLLTNTLFSSIELSSSFVFTISLDFFSSIILGVGRSCEGRELVVDSTMVSFKFNSFLSHFVIATMYRLLNLDLLKSAMIDSIKSDCLGL